MSEQPIADSRPSTPAEAFQSVLEGKQTSTEETSTEETSTEAEEVAADNSEEEPAQAPESVEGDEPLLEEEQSLGESPATYRLPIGDDGEIVELSADELQSHLLRQRDYTRKTQSLAEARKTLEAERNSIRAIHSAQAEIESELQTLRDVDPVEPDQTYWDQLKVDNPMQWMIERQEWTERRLEKEQTEKRYAELQSQLQQQRTLEHQQLLAEEQLRLVQYIPEWGDKDKAENERSALRNYGLEQGFTDEELATVFDHRAVLMMHKAMRYDALQTKRDNLKTKALQRPMSAGAAELQSPRRHTELTKAKQRLAKTQTRSDATAAFQALLDH